MFYGVIFFFDIIQDLYAYFQMLFNEILRDDSAVFIPSEIMGRSETNSKAPVGIRLAKPTVKIVAVSISTAMARVLFRYSLKRSSYSHTRRFVV